MSTIPPNWLGSIIQSQGAEKRAAEKQASDSTSQSERSGFSNRLQDIIESEDRDSQVYSDAEGQGSQGRAFSEGETDAEPSTEDKPAGDPPDDENLDLQA